MICEHVQINELQKPGDIIFLSHEESVGSFSSKFTLSHSGNTALILFVDNSYYSVAVVISNAGIDETYINKFFKSRFVTVNVLDVFS
jgi:hypothetical protein